MDHRLLPLSPLLKHGGKFFISNICQCAPCTHTKNTEQLCVYWSTGKRSCLCTLYILFLPKQPGLCSFLFYRRLIFHCQKSIQANIIYSQRQTNVLCKNFGKAILPSILFCWQKFTGTLKKFYNSLVF